MKNCIAILSIIILPIIAFCQSQQVEAETLLKTLTTWNGVKFPPQQISEPEITVVRIKIPPKSELKTHKHSVINIAYMLKGELKVRTLDGKILNVKAGDAVAETIENWHFGKNESDEVAELVVVYFGQKGYSRSVPLQ